MLVDMARDIAWRAAPGIMAERAREYERKLRRQKGIVAVGELFVAEHGSTVVAGPFEGLRYPAEWVSLEADAPVAKLTGLYESELTPIIERVIAEPPPVIVDIGGADGYYAAGFALKCQASRVIVFEAASSARTMCRRMAQVNQLRFSLHRAATSDRIRRLPLDDAFVLCDVEGAEGRLFDARSIRDLRTTTVLVELHEDAVAGIGDLLRARFAATHGCRIIPALARDAALVEPYGLMGDDAALAVSEWRPDGMSWALFTPM